MSDLPVAAIAAPSPSNVVRFPRRRRARPMSDERDHHEDAMSMLKSAIELTQAGAYGRALNVAGLAQNALKRACELYGRP